MSRIVKTRSSVNHKVTYQISYEVIMPGRLSEYKLRRGIRGAWTKPQRVRSIELLLYNLGFTRKPDLLADFMVEVYFTRGEIRLTPKMVVGLLDSDELMSKYFYPKISKKDDKYWILPANCVKTDEHNKWLKKFFLEFG